MVEGPAPGIVLTALQRELSEQGQGGYFGGDRKALRTYPIKGAIDLIALAEAVESALGADTSDQEDAKSPAELNAANDG